MSRVWIALKLNVGLIIFTGVLVGYAVASRCEEKGEFVVELLYPHDFEALRCDNPRLEITLLVDDDDLLRQTTALQEQSKPELEPLVKQYMYAAEALNRVRTEERSHQEQQARLMQSFTSAERRIRQVLERYASLIARLLDRHTCRKFYKTPLTTTTLTFRDVPPGQYRAYGVLTYTTTRLTWFEPVHIKGGECRTITFTRDNLYNPYWTDLNWWSFVNLDFSKHH